MPSFPTPLDAYPAVAGPPCGSAAARATPFNVAATVIFALAIVHTFLAKQFLVLAHHAQDRHDAPQSEAGRRPLPPCAPGSSHFFGEIEVVFGLWAVPLVATIACSTAGHGQGHVDGHRRFHGGVFVVAIMALASTRPVMAAAGRRWARWPPSGGSTSPPGGSPSSGSGRSSASSSPSRRP
jgi:hypothetical protein